jgi:hypothetical protein
MVPVYRFYATFKARRGRRIMSMAARGVTVRPSLFVILAMMFLATPSSARKISLKEALVGHWQLVSVSVNGRSPYGADPHGSLFLDDAGHFSVIVVSDGNARSLAYFGTYTINVAEKSMVIHIEDSAGGGTPNAAGRELKRLFTLRGDELSVQNELATGDPGGVTVTWKRAN